MKKDINSNGKFHNTRKRYERKPRQLFTVEMFDPRKDSIVRHLKYKNLESWEISWISFHPHLKIKSVKRQSERV